MSAERGPTPVQLVRHGSRRAIAHRARAPPTRSSTSRRRWPATTSSSRTGRWSRRSSARAAAGPPSARRAVGEIAGGEAIEWGRQANENPPVAAHARPLRQPHRRGRVPPRLAPAAGRRRLARRCTRCPGREPQPGAHVARAADVHGDGPGRGRARLPDLDDLLGRAGAARDARAGRRVGAAPDLDHLRPAAGAAPPTRRARCAAWR